MMWKTFAGRCIYRSLSGVKVYDNFYYRWLTLGSDALQTVLNKSAPEKPGLNYIKALIFAAQMHPGNCCLLGLGGAGAAHALAPFLNNFKLTAIDYNEEVIALATQFFMTDKIENLTIIHEEASAFVNHCSLQFQHVMVDLFNKDSFPSTCYNEHFFSNCQRILLPEGILAVNLANRYEQRPIYAMIKKLFAHSVIAIPIKKCANVVIIAAKSENANTLINYFNKSHELQSLTWDDQWGFVARFK